MREIFEKCNACRRIIETSEGEILAGFELQARQEHDGKIKIGESAGISGYNFEEIYPEIEVGRKYRICYVCVLKALGVKRFR